MRDDLAQRIEAGCAVVTPNRRLAAHLKREYDTRQAAFGTAVWLTADILPLSAFVERAYHDALYSDRGGKLPTLLADSQARELWEETIRASRWGDELLEVPQTVTQAMEAWRLAHAWRVASVLEKFHGTDDARAFA